MARKKVVIALSGGVDSSVTAALLKEEGYECIGMHLRFWEDPFTEEDKTKGIKFPRNKCCTLEGLEDARRIASLLDIPFYVMNVTDAFKENVVDYFVNTYRDGDTPNPCIECNRNIKFGLLLQRARELDAEFLATGHYVKKLTIRARHPQSGYPAGPAKRDTNGSHELWMARDKSKDQSYFLYHLNQEKLSQVIFPLGDFEKPQVYDLARRFKLTPVESKPESQGICFFPDATPGTFLKRYLSESAFVSGPIKTVDGEVIGEHQGLPNYTIGQRKGIGIGGRGGRDSEPWYVIDMDREQNTLIVGQKDQAFRKTMMVGNLSFIDGARAGENSFEQKVSVRIRHRAHLESAKIRVSRREDSVLAEVSFDKPVFGISPGQSAVFYDGEKVLGGGIIERG